MIEVNPIEKVVYYAQIYLPVTFEYFWTSKGIGIDLQSLVEFWKFGKNSNWAGPHTSVP
jgi:hypothetical protein